VVTSFAWTAPFEQIASFRDLLLPRHLVRFHTKNTRLGIYVKREFRKSGVSSQTFLDFSDRARETQSGSCLIGSPIERLFQLHTRILE